MKWVLIFLIRIYQKIPGSWHNYCKHFPSCSNYAIGVLQEHGTFKGVYLSCKRILKCNHWNEGGYDPIPLKGGKYGKD